MSFTISDHILFTTRMPKQEMAMELAVVMYHRGRLPLSRAADFAEMDRDRFRYLLLSRGIELKPEQDDGDCHGAG
jgi:predicted HTH domain antitoxin